MEEDQVKRKEKESKETVKIPAELLAEEFREFYSSPCAMRAFEEREEEQDKAN